MRLTYVVLLKPREIRFTENTLAPIFDNGIPLLETLAQLENREILHEDIPTLEVVFYQEKWEWYTLNNRRLWVFQELEKQGKCQYIKTKRVENIENILDYPAVLYEAATLSQQSHSFSWKGKKLQITCHESNSREVEVYCKKEPRDDLSRELVPTAKRDVFTRLGSAKSPRKSYKLDRYHPYSSSDHPPRQDANGAPRRLRRVSETSNLSTSSSGSRFHLAGYKFDLSVWLKKRREFFYYVYSLRTGRVRSPSRMVACLYTCGVCFKSFKAKVSLDQHCVDLNHWACVRCGRFFATFTSLGQHKLDVRHVI